MNDGDRKLNMPHALPPDLRMGDLDAAPVAHDPAIPDAFVFSAVAFPVADGPENLLTEKAITFRLE